MKDWLKANADIRFGLILLFITVSTGHVGRLFADREAAGQWFIGYALALGIDLALAIALYELSYTKERTYKLLALAGFMTACGISAGFNVYYYREFYPGDPWELSILLGMAAPVLAAFFALLKGKGDIERRETKNQIEIEKFTITQREETKRLVAIEKEKTKRAIPVQKKRKGLTVKKRRELIYAALLQDLGQSPADLGKRFGVSAQTIRNDFKALAQQGKINYKDGRVTLRPQAVARAGEG